MDGQEKTRYFLSETAGCIAGLRLKLASNAFEHQRTVGATKAEIVLQCNINTRIAGRVGAVVQVALGILIKQVDGWRYFLGVQRHNGEHAFNATSTTQ